MTPAQLSKATGARIDRATEWLPVIEQAMREFGIDTQRRIAMFLAQIGHESGGMRYTVEIWGNTAAQIGYEGRKGLGNNQTGDGFKYRGRGLIQITGRSNYTQVAAALGIDCINEPDLLAEPINAARSAAWWWKSRDLNRFADDDDCKGCTKVINGGYNGLDQRLALYEAAKAALPDIEIPSVRTPSSLTLIVNVLKTVFSFFSRGKK